MRTTGTASRESTAKAQRCETGHTDRTWYGARMASLPVSPPPPPADTPAPRPRAVGPTCGDLSTGVPEMLPDELFTTIIDDGRTRIERIVSRGHTSPPGFWYCQDEDEFVLLLSGSARLEVEGRGEITLAAGQWLDLPRGLRHRVSYTAPDADTIWLAVFRR